jgi:hypothetical protein
MNPWWLLLIVPASMAIGAYLFHRFVAWAFSQFYPGPRH